MTTLQRASGNDSPLTVIVHFWSWTGIIVVAARLPARSSPGSAAPGRSGLAADPAGSGGAARAGRTGQPVHHRLAEQARGHGRLVRGHRRGLRGRPAHRGLARPGPARTVTGGACVVALCFPVTLGASQSLDVRDQLAAIRPPSSRSSARWPTTALAAAGRGPVDRRVLPARPAASGSDGRARGTSSCPPAPPPAGRAPKPGSSGRQRGHVRRCTSRRATSPWSR